MIPAPRLTWDKIRKATITRADAVRVEAVNTKEAGGST